MASPARNSAPPFAGEFPRDFQSSTIRGAVGRWRVARDRADAWHLISPDNLRVAGAAVNGVGPLADEPGRENAAALLRRWGFDLLGRGADAAVAADGLAQIGVVDLLSCGPQIRLGGSRLPDVFAADWGTLAKAWAHDKIALSDGPDWVGWWPDANLGWAWAEPESRPTLLQLCLSLEPNMASYHVAWEFVLALHDGSWDRLMADWGVSLPNRESLRELTRNEQGITTPGYRRDHQKWSEEFARHYVQLAGAAVMSAAPGALVFSPPVLRGSEPLWWLDIAAGGMDVVTVRPDAKGRVAPMRGPLWVDDFSWARPAIWDYQRPGDPEGFTRAERMLSRGREALLALRSNPAVVGYAWADWTDPRAARGWEDAGLIDRHGHPNRLHAELLERLQTGA